MPDANNTVPQRKTALIKSRVTKPQPATDVSVSSDPVHKKIKVRRPKKSNTFVANEEQVQQDEIIFEIPAKQAEPEKEGDIYQRSSSLHVKSGNNKPQFSDRSHYGQQQRPNFQKYRTDNRTDSGGDKDNQTKNTYSQGTRPLYRDGQQHAYNQGNTTNRGGNTTGRYNNQGGYNQGNTTNRGGNTTGRYNNQGGYNQGNTTNRGGNTTGRYNNQGGYNQGNTTNRGGNTTGRYNNQGGYNQSNATNRGGNTTGRYNNQGGYNQGNATNRDGNTTGRYNNQGGYNQGNATNRGGNTTGRYNNQGGYNQGNATNRGGNTTGRYNNQGGYNQGNATNRGGNTTGRYNNQGGYNQGNATNRSGNTAGQYKQNQDAGSQQRPWHRSPQTGGGRVAGNAEATTKSHSFSGANTTQQKRTFKTVRKRVFVNKRNNEIEKNLNFPSRKQVQVANPIPKSVSIADTVTIADLAKKMNLKSSDLLSKLMSMGVMTSINASIDYDTAQLLASEYDCDVKLVSLYEQTIIETTEDKKEDLRLRPAVVTIMGHVDHGKTTLLDTIRQSNIVGGEQGNITQHIGAYRVIIPNGAVTFLDTPGHAAFTQMRLRGAQVTDIVVLVIAANDGVMPQTKEAIDHAKEANVPIIIALNKIDVADSNVDKIFQQLSEIDIVPEEWGGTVPVCKVSALKHEGIENLLEHIVLQAEIMGLSANPDARASGTVIESRIEMGKGVVLTVLVENGTLRVGDPFVSGIYFGKVRALFDDKGRQIKEATPATPVEVIGVEDIPSAGDPFQVTENDKTAKQISMKRQEMVRHKAGQNVKRVTTETLYSSIEEGNQSTHKVIVKGDVHGSVEAIKMSLESLGNEEIRVQVIHASAGAINDNDILLASASKADLIGFNVRPSQKAQQLANQEKVNIRKYNIIFDIIEDTKVLLTGLLSPEYREEKVAEVEVRQAITIPRIGVIAGSYVRSGTVERNYIAKLFRKDKEIASGKITSLKRFKDDVNVVETGFECGVGIHGVTDIQPDDIIVVFKEVKVDRVFK